MSIFGYGVQGSDPNLIDKISALKRKRKSPADTVNDFIEHDLGVDPRTLPFNLAQAKTFIANVMQDVPAVRASVIGNSMGLTEVVFSPDGHPEIPCPNCGVTSGYWDDYPTVWCCYDCDEYSEITTPPVESVTAWTRTTSVADWHDLERMFTAFVANVLADQTGSRRPIYRFTVELTYPQQIEVTPVAPDRCDPDPRAYPTGTVLLLERVRPGSEPEQQYVRVGGLFNDSDLTNLETMQPIVDLTGWSVIEEVRT